MISGPQSRAAFNNSYAQAAIQGDPRYQIKQFDRGGVSRGAGAMNQASIQGASQFAQGVADAYRDRAQTGLYNQNLAMQQQQATDTYQQAVGAAKQQDKYQDALAKLERAQMGTQFITSLLGGLIS
jgi:hypothetical protein